MFWQNHSPSDTLLSLIAFGPIRINEIKYTFLWKVVGQIPFPSILESGGRTGVTSTILPPYVAIWMHLKDRKKLSLGDIAGFLIQLCVISLCASLYEFEDVIDTYKLKSSRICVLIAFQIHAFTHFVMGQEYNDVSVSKVTPFLWNHTAF